MNIKKPIATLASPVSRSPGAVSADTALGKPNRGLPLGVLLGVTISVLVALLLGGLTTFQLHRDAQQELEAREGLLAESLVPLAEQIEGAAAVGEFAKHLSLHRLAEVSLGRRPDYQAVLLDADENVLALADPDGSESPPEGSLRASIQVHSELLPTGAGRLVGWQNASEFSFDLALRRREALFDIGITVLAVVLLVQLAIHLLVSRPLNRLLTALERFEQGYPARFRGGQVSRELRWLEWRLHQLSVGLTGSARLLVAAHRRATATSKSRNDNSTNLRAVDPLKIDSGAPSTENAVLRRFLLDRCALLEDCDPNDPAARSLALETWERDVVEAERYGEMELRTRLEDTSMKILEPEAFDRTSRDVKRLVKERSTWCKDTETAIRSALAADGIGKFAVQHRIKHTAGVWRKMQEKNIVFDEVHDLFAFRIIVPTLDDCYLALHATHQLFEPEPFRFKDYIASPKANGYQSIHTSLHDQLGNIFEVQIRTVDMHTAAEDGKAAHWRYKADKSARVTPRSRLTVRGLAKLIR